ncbi:hypothetical protein WDU94_005505 [Cyamophila willieti]
MVLALENNKESNDEKKKYECSLNDVNHLSNVDLSHFVSSNTKSFFHRFGLKTTFLQLPPSQWSQDENYVYSKNIVKKIKTVNDTAERGVKLIEEYNSALTKNEEQRQFVVQVVSEYRKNFLMQRKLHSWKKFSYLVFVQ